jgi:hypothetical protein
MNPIEQRNASTLKHNENSALVLAALATASLANVDVERADLEVKNHRQRDKHNLSRMQAELA